MSKNYDFDLHVDVDNATGKTLAVYFQIRKGHAARVRELVSGKAFANYSARGRLLGIELLAPCKVKVLETIANKEPTEVKVFLRTSIPRAMAVA
jgi:hypothetical protein